MRLVIFKCEERTCWNSRNVQWRVPLAQEKQAYTDRCNTRSLAPRLPRPRQRGALLRLACHAFATMCVCEF